MAALLVSIICLALSTAAGAQDPHPAEAAAPTGPSAQAQDRLPPGAAAAARDTSISLSQLDRVLVDRYAMSPDGREVLSHLIDCAVIEHLADSQGVEVSEAQISQRFAELDRQAQDSGVEGGLVKMLRERGVVLEVFLETLRLGMLHEALTRSALDIEPTTPLTPEQQTVWLEAQRERMGVLEAPLPFEEGVAARVGEDVAVSEVEYRESLREMLDPTDVQETCYLLLLRALGEARFGATLEAADYDLAAEAELERRRAKAAADPRYQGIDYERILDAQGVNVATFHEDPAVRVAALAHLWVDRTNTDEDLQRQYEERRDHYEGRYGMALQTRAIFLNAARITNDQNPRTFERARAELAALKEEIRTEEEFSTVATATSEDAFTRRNGGDLGLVTRRDTRVDAEMLEWIFAAGAAGELPEGGLAVGPVELSTGMALLWISARRPSPPWEEMREHVHRELRKSFIDETLTREEVLSFLVAPH